MAEQWNDEQRADWQIQKLRENDRAIDELIRLRFGIPVPETAVSNPAQIIEESSTLSEVPALYAKSA